MCCHILNCARACQAHEAFEGRAQGKHEVRGALQPISLQVFFNLIFNILFWKKHDVALHKNKVDVGR